MAPHQARKVDTVIFLGAGASATEGAPLQGALFSDYFRLRKTSPTRTQRALSMQDDLRDFFEFFFGITVAGTITKATAFPTFEEALGIIELALQRNEHFRDFTEGKQEAKLNQVRESLIFLICVILDQKLENAGAHHKQLVRTLDREGALCTTIFASFNYDIIIDNVLTDLYQEHDLDYGAEFANFATPAGHRWHWERPRPPRAIKLLKLHGSLNWLYCPTCGRLNLTPKDKGVIQLIFDPEACRCLYCQSPTAPIVIPPTFFKVMDNFHLQAVWREAEQAAVQAKRLVFCGYSLPDADMHVKYLLKRTEVNRTAPIDVFIVNEHAKKRRAERREEKSRYVRMFRKTHTVTYTNLSFEAFSRGGLASLMGDL